MSTASLINAVESPLPGTEATVELISDLPTFETLEAQWHELARDIPSPMVQFEWMVSAAEAYQKHKLFIVVIRAGGTIQAVAPLVLRRYGLTHRLERLDYAVQEPQQLIARDEEYLNLLFKILGKTPHPLLLNKVPANCDDVQCLRNIRGAGLRVITSGHTADSYVPFDDPDIDLDKRVSASRRSTLRRKRRAAEKHGPVQFTFLRPSAQQLPDLLDEVFRVESSGWKGKAATGLQQDLGLGSFFRLYGDRMARHGALRIGFMSIAKTTAAARLDVVWGRKSWELKIGYDERFGDCSPGLLLSHEALKHGQQEGLAGHHFLGSAEPWQATWAAETADRVKLRQYSTSIASGVALVQDAGIRLARPVRHAARDLWPRIRASFFPPTNQRLAARPPDLVPRGNRLSES